MSLVFVVDDMSHYPMVKSNGFSIIGDETNNVQCGKKVFEVIWTSSKKPRTVEVLSIGSGV